MRAALAFALCSALCFASAVASAQIAGVPVDSLTPVGMTRVEVDLPEHGGVRLYFAPEGQTRATLRVHVLLAPSAEAAREAAVAYGQTVAGELDALPGLGDRAAGGAALVALRRGNVFVVVQRLDGHTDCRPVAGAIDAALRAAPRGPASTTATVAAPAPGSTLQPPAGILAVHVLATGAASARRTRAGWVVAPRGQGAWTVTVLAADDWLRRIRVERSGPRGGARADGAVVP